MAGKGREEQTVLSNTTLQVVLLLDLVQSSRLMSEREVDTINFVDRSFRVFSDCSGRYAGEILRNTGDGALIVFPSVTAAIGCALDIHAAVPKIAGKLGSLAAFRAGIHCGEATRLEGMVYGNAVNLAARLESIAPPGGVCVSQEVYQIGRQTEGLEFESMGSRRFKGFVEPISVYRVSRNTKTSGRKSVNTLFVNVIGGLHLSRLDADLPVPRSAKSRGIIACLAASPKTSSTLGSLSRLLWPEKAPAEALKAVRRQLTRFNSAIQIELDGQNARLDPSLTEVDIIDLFDDIRSGRVSELLTHDSEWPEQILIGLEQIGPVFASWLSVTRNDWRARVSQALEAALDRFEPRDGGLRDSALALLCLEPAHERAARELIKHYHAVENHGAAQRVFETLKANLHERFGLQPKPQTVAAAKGQVAHAPEIHATERLPLRIQLGSFECEDTTQAAVVEGFRNELLSSLASFRGWSVVETKQLIGSTTNFYDYQLTGRYQPNSGELIVTLSEPEHGRLIWSDNFNLNLNAFQSARKLLVGRIASTLEVYISTDRVNAPSKDVSKSTVDSWLRGERYFSRWTPEDHDTAAEIYAELIESEPEFAPAYASLASIFNVRHIVRPGIQRDAVSSQRAYELSNRATELDPLDARNQLATAWSASLEGDFDKATLHMEMAANLNPNSPRTIISCAMGFAFFGDHKKAGELLAHSLRCSPLLLEYQWCYAASVYYLAGDFEQALSAAKQGRDRIIDNPGWHAATLVRLGRLDEARERFDDLTKIVSGNWYLNEPATPDAICNWFVGIYPMRRHEERGMLEEALGDAAVLN